MDIKVFENSDELGKNAAIASASIIKAAIAENGIANIILSTGASQFDTLAHLVNEKGIDWSKVSMFHLDEYVGIEETHPASFRKYLKDRFLSKLPTLKATYLLDGSTELIAEEECEKMNKIISKHAIDLALVGIGENGHIAFNDPPADFEIDKAFFIIRLDNMVCRKQQMEEGWFSTIDEVPLKSITMSVKQIMKSKKIICAVPDARKAIAIKNTLEESVSKFYPSTILKKHKDCSLFLDNYSASLIAK